MDLHRCLWITHLLISNGFHDLTICHVFQTLFTDFDTILSFYGLEMEADILAQRDGRDDAVRRPRFLSQIHFSCFSNSLVCRKSGFQHFCQQLVFYHGFGRNRLGQNDRNDRGIILGFHQKSDFDSCFAGQSPCFPENLNFHFLCLNNLCLFGGQICEAFICLEYTI